MTRLPTAVPKPRRRKAQRASAKKRTSLARNTPVKKVNRSRKASEFARAYGSAERVEWMRAQPCVVCGYAPSENAHIETGGMGRKADNAKVVPLCGPRVVHSFVATNAEWGCHRIFHALGRTVFEKVKQINLDVQAAIVEARWQEFRKGA